MLREDSAIYTTGEPGNLQAVTPHSTDIGSRDAATYSLSWPESWAPVGKQSS
jgi:hypothetical protein